MKAKETACPVCGKQRPAHQMVPGALVRQGIAELIMADHPDWNEKQSVCRTDLNHYRSVFLEKVLQQEKGEVSQLDRQILDSIREGELTAANVNKLSDENLSFGQHLADRIAEFGGSWTFIIIFGGILLCWITLNVYMVRHPFDPYPFILLNLVLSCLAALQAPVIMMSQNRQEAKDRLRAEQDYRINLKAELEIRALHEKMDHLLLQQWERLLEIQQLQVEMMEELGKKG